jgi:asparagine synthase (glutamine-hydrolysing)
MAERVAHRGPDDAGVWAATDGTVALAFRRLAIIDLSPAGHQPMLSACGRYVLVFNGEIYNHRELRCELERAGAHARWRGHSDTETLLASLIYWGVRGALERCAGMFAFALWDQRERRLILARDRMGEKPLYYGRQGGTFLFGSELKALRAHPAFRAEPSRDALYLLLRYNYIPTPYTVYESIWKLPPGCFLTIAAQEEHGSIQEYWSLTNVLYDGEQNAFEGDEGAAADELERTLSAAVRAQSVADVPLGALLSGGIDSSTIVSLMQANATRPVKTFTIGFNEKRYDEASHARAVAKHLRTDHTELVLSPQDALRLVPDLPSVYDEPFADASQLPTQLVMQLARAHVTVGLSGDGGDELFGGYNRYRLVPALWSGMKWIPSKVRNAIGSALVSVDAPKWDHLLGRIAQRLRVAQPGDKIHKLGNRIQGVAGPDDLFHAMVSEWQEPAQVVRGSSEPRSLLSERSSWPRLYDGAARMMALDALTYLPDDILAKVDRAAMANSLETRAPFLDVKVVEFASRIPISMKIRNGHGKWILRKVLERHVPRELIDRPKMGFGIPLDQWLRGPLRQWVEDLLDPASLAQEGYFDPGPVRQVWDAHLRGRSFGHRLWSVLMFQAWLANQSRTRTAADICHQASTPALVDSGK